MRLFWLGLLVFNEHVSAGSGALIEDNVSDIWGRSFWDCTVRSVISKKNLNDLSNKLLKVCGGISHCPGLG